MSKDLVIHIKKKVSGPSAIGKFKDFFLDKETPLFGYISKKDRVIFTDKRIVIIYLSGFAQRKVNFMSLPYGKIGNFAFTSTGKLDLGAEIKLWGAGVGMIKLDVPRKINSKEIIRFLTNKQI